MRAADVLIAWTPAPFSGADLPPEVRATAGQIAILAWPDCLNLVRAYARTLGGPDPDWRAASADDISDRLRVAFRTLVMRDGINPMTVHATFMQIDEYRRQIFCEQVKSCTPSPRETAGPGRVRRLG